MLLLHRNCGPPTRPWSSAVYCTGIYSKKFVCYITNIVQVMRITSLAAHTLSNDVKFQYRFSDVLNYVRSPYTRWNIQCTSRLIVYKHMADGGFRVRAGFTYYCTVTHRCLMHEEEYEQRIHLRNETRIVVQAIGYALHYNICTRWIRNVLSRRLSELTS
jgi:hypothetical protein